MSAGRNRELVDQLLSEFQRHLGCWLRVFVRTSFFVFSFLVFLLFGWFIFFVVNAGLHFVLVSNADRHRFPQLAVLCD